MATARNYICRPSYRFLDADLAASASRDSSSFELDESDLYSSPRPDSPDSRGDRPAPNARIRKKPSAARHPSLPVNVPDWPKILRGEYRENRRRDSLENGFFDDDDDDDDAKDDGVEEDGGRGGNGGGRRDRRWVPPHELAARTARTATATASSSSVTLKGRDLSRVRNAIWAKTGFQD
ncbi:protein S40-4-like [Syzygium oleosum]|uniref:protein S40-4-like n=1 Tax=Syzygium oleosum TaxID=219896 RepID=UPI0011D1D4AF|nr:protein S40-4-like [Syzygium oleosum]